MSDVKRNPAQSVAAVITVDEILDGDHSGSCGLEATLGVGRDVSGGSGDHRVFYLNRAAEPALGLDGSLDYAQGRLRSVPTQAPVRISIRSPHADGMPMLAKNPSATSSC